MSWRLPLSTLLVTALGASALAAPAAAPAASAKAREHPSQVALDWQRTAIRTIYTQAGSPIPVGVLYLGFTSLAVHQAVEQSIRAPRSSEEAAVAAAAHGVLRTYFPAFASSLDADYAASLAEVRDGPAQDRGVQIGHAAAAALVADRADDGRGDPTIAYSKPNLPGYWQPAPGGTMLAPWLGSVDYLVLDSPVAVDGPDAMTSADYTADYDEVRRLGSATSTERSAFQTDTARFYNSNSAIMVGEALLDRLEDEPVGLKRTARVFATMHVAMADSLIRCWELKRDVGFWRPSQAVAGAGSDGNPLTAPETGWVPLIANPPYSDYVSGHGSLTAPAVETIRMEFGEGYALTLHSYLTNTDRHYTTLSAIERDAFDARIWGGLHFRDAMDDAYAMGHETARRVAVELKMTGTGRWMRRR